jgi:transketolase
MMNMQKAAMPTRKAIAERLQEYGAVDPEFMVFEADIGYSTYSHLFGDEYPDRYFNLGIQEMNVVNSAAGMAAEGRTVVVCGYGVFITMRAVEAVRTTVCYQNLNVKFLSSHGGITPAIDGVSHQATEDIAFMSTIPNMKVFAPADTQAARKTLDLVMQTPGPCFVRLMRDPLFDIYGEDDAFVLGGSKTLREGGDLTIAAYADTVFTALEAAEELAGEEIEAEVLDMYSLKPYDQDTVLKSVARTGALLVVEDHQKRNGLGSELARLLLARDAAVPFAHLGLEDTFAESGAYEKLTEKYGLSPRHIAEQARELAEVKRNRI